AAVLGADVMRHMVDIDAQSGPMRVTGFVSLPSHTRGNRFSQFFFVNNRAVRERTLVHAVQDANRNVIPYKRYPVVVLSVAMPPDEVDVNVHPSKLEVRVRNERVVFGTVRNAIKSALSARSEPAMAVSASPAREAGASFTAERPAWPRAAAGPGDPHAAVDGGARIRDAFEDYLSRKPGAAAATSGTPPALSFPRREAGMEEVARVAPADDSLYWQFNHTFIFIQVRGGIVVIDQHAAHERIIFDRGMRLLEDAASPSQQILFSIPIDLSLRELEVFRASRDIFQKLGFTLEPFGGTSILVRGYPQGIRNWADGRLLLQIFDDILAERAPGDTHTEKLVASFACRSAIKAGQRLSLEEMKLLADQLFAVENPYSCPHGRPTIHRLSLDEIERWFHRR
ncbi:MAG TPA: DNA mismatch repair endonuclease MutL, partial [Candidatus Krumholzibacteria bacterium]|nr:DNA mismatch repair endonuclease MutL [Candidatus Krumholzibacteria bacterium]